MTAHLFARDVIAASLDVDAKSGLSPQEAKTRLERDGRNRLEGSGKISIGEVLLRQVSNALTIVGPFPSDNVEFESKLLM